jgi:endonuclease YncB( thermonuclease family)
MPFIVIKGTFHIVGANKNGNATGFQPDGDSIQFRPDETSLLDRLHRRAHPYRLTSIKSVNLRFEGIDAPEIHYKGARQPSPFAEAARDFLTGRIGMNPVAYSAGGVTAKPPANDGQRGYILSRELEVNGRPVSFVYVGNPPDADGKEVHLTVQRAKRSLNYQLLAAGQAYPLFYDSLFYDLRAVFAGAASSARSQNRGIWKNSADVMRRFTIASRADAEAAKLLYPKLFRRLADYLKTHNGLGGFVKWMNDEDENDEVWTLPEWNRTHFDNVLEIAGNKVKLKRLPMQLVWVSA